MVSALACTPLALCVACLRSCQQIVTLILASVPSSRASCLAALVRRVCWTSHEVQEVTVPWAQLRSRRLGLFVWGWPDSHQMATRACGGSTPRSRWSGACRYGQNRPRYLYQTCYQDCSDLIHWHCMNLSSICKPVRPWPEVCCCHGACTTFDYCIISLHHVSFVLVTWTCWSIVFEKKVCVASGYHYVKSYSIGARTQQ